MVEPEMAFADLPTNLGVAEDFVKFLVKYVLENSAEDLEFLQKYFLSRLFLPLSCPP
jgi:asparaginyl-tRNA synthetase